MELVELNRSDKENSVKYSLRLQGEEIGYGYILSREVNPIEIYINQDYQSNGYGKILFNSLLNILKNKNLKGIIFSVERNNNRFMNIIEQAGAIEFGREEMKINYVLKF